MHLGVALGRRGRHGSVACGPFSSATPLRGIVSGSRCVRPTRAHAVLFICAPRREVSGAVVKRLARPLWLMAATFTLMWSPATDAGVIARRMEEAASDDTCCSEREGSTGRPETTAQQAQAHPDVAWDEAVGFGAAATGGRGQAYVDVLSLRDTSAGSEPAPGSLRAALSGGNRTVRFRVSGNIELRRSLVVSQPNITIDGSDAPDGGIALWGKPLVITADNVVVRNLRFRGSHPTDRADGLAIGSGRDILIDHVSCSWATDECISIYGYADTGSVRRVTIQNSLLAEAPDGSAAYGMLIAGDVGDVTLYRNVFAKNANRNPQITTGQRHAPGGMGERLAGVGRYELIQNIVYDMIYSTRLGNQSSKWLMQVDVIGNLWKAGPHWRRPKVPVSVLARPRSLGPIHVFLSDNDGPDHFDRMTGRSCDYFSLEELNAPCAGYSAHAASSRLIREHEFPGRRASEDFESILENAGAIAPCRDSLDTRIVEEIRSGTGQHARLPGSLPDLTKACQ